MRKRNDCLHTALRLLDMWETLYWAAPTCLYVVLPFAYLHTESIAFCGRQGFCGRMIEVTLLSTLILFLSLGIAYAVHVCGLQ